MQHVLQTLIRSGDCSSVLLANSVAKWGLCITLAQKIRTLVGSETILHVYHIECHDYDVKDIYL